MTYKEFIAKMKEEIRRQNNDTIAEISFYPGGFTSQDPKERELIQSFNKQYVGKNDAVLLEDMLVVRKKPVNDVNSIFRIAVGRLYYDYLKNGFQTAMKPIVDCSNVIFDYNSIRARAASDFEAIRSTLILRPLNLESHGKDLKQRRCIYKRIGDIALVLYQIVGEGEILTTSRILESDIKRWNLPYSIDDIMQEALQNTLHKYPPVVMNYRKGKEVDVLKGEYTADDIMEAGFGLLTSSGTPNGAMALFYPSVRRKLREVIGSDFIAVPMNILDVMILKPDSPRTNGALGIARSPTPYGESLSNMAFYITKDRMVPCKVHEDMDAVDQDHRFHIQFPSENR